MPVALAGGWGTNLELTAALLMRNQRFTGNTGLH